MNRSIVAGALICGALLLVNGCSSSETSSRPPSSPVSERQPLTVTARTPEGFILTTTIRDDVLVAGRIEAAIVTLVNSGESTSVAPPNLLIEITDSLGTVVYKSNERRLRHPITFEEFPAGGRIEKAITFEVPSPGSYGVRGYAAGSVTPAIEFQSVQRQ